MSRAFLLLPLVALACAATEAPEPLTASSPASTAHPSGRRPPVATVLLAQDPSEAARSPLLTAPAPAPKVDHSHHHHHGGGGSAP